MDKFVEGIFLFLVEGEGLPGTFLKQFVEGVSSFREVFDKTAVDVT